MIGKLVIVDWEDAWCNTDAWKSLESIIRDNQPRKCQSIGILLAKDKNTLTVVPHRFDIENETYQSGTGEMHIPAKAVKKIKVIK